MPPTAIPREGIIASCSFCGKPHTAVQRLIAGPGVYICDECIGLSATIVEDAARTTPEESARRRSQYYDLPADDILAMLPALLLSADRVERELAGWVSRLRERGASWQTVADAAGLDVETARRRFGTALPEQASPLWRGWGRGDVNSAPPSRRQTL